MRDLETNYYFCYDFDGLQVSLRQQVRDLETQLAQLKAYQREQAIKLGAMVADKEALQFERAQLASSK